MVLEAAELKLGRTVNEYNYKQKCDPPPLCYDMTNVSNRYYHFKPLLGFYLFSLS